MLKKQITELILVSAKFFLDLDHTYCAYIILMTATTALLLKQSIYTAGRVLTDALSTIREDINFWGKDQEGIVTNSSR